MIFLKQDYFFQHNKFLRKQNIRRIFLTKFCDNILFVSHRWENVNDPDPHGKQFEEVKSIMLSGNYDACFYDYSCINQKPRSQDEDDEFRSDLTKMRSIIETSDMFIPLRCLVDYHKRAWCCFEYYNHNKIVGSDPSLDKRDINRSNYNIYLLLILSIIYLMNTEIVKLFGPFYYRVSMVNDRFVTCDGKSIVCVSSQINFYVNIIGLSMVIALIAISLTIMINFDLFILRVGVLKWWYLKLTMSEESIVFVRRLLNKESTHEEDKIKMINMI